MRKIHRYGAAFIAAAIATLASAGAEASSTRTFVSGHGTDSGICGVGAPCRTFAYAITQTAAAGEIVVLDSAGYGSVTIGQSITITNPGGVEAAITAPSGGTAVTINSAGPSNITLRGLTLEGGFVGANGIDVISGIPGGSPNSTLHLIDCVVKDFTGAGIVVEPTGTGVGTPVMIMSITDSFVLDNAVYGIKFAPHTVNLAPSILRTSVSGNGTGINIDASLAVIQNSQLVSNTSSAITATVTAVYVMKASTALLTNFGNTADVTNAGLLFLYDHNSISLLANSGAAQSDGSNNVSLTGTSNALSPVSTH
jgi:hypothetical protein